MQYLHSKRQTRDFRITSVKQGSKHSPMRHSVTSPQSAKKPLRSSSEAVHGRFLQKMVRLPLAAEASTSGLGAASPSFFFVFLAGCRRNACHTDVMAACNGSNSAVQTEAWPCYHTMLHQEYRHTSSNAMQQNKSRLQVQQNKQVMLAPMLVSSHNAGKQPDQHNRCPYSTASDRTTTVPDA